MRFVVFLSVFIVLLPEGGMLRYCLEEARGLRMSPTGLLDPHFGYLANQKEEASSCLIFAFILFVRAGSNGAF